MVTVFPKAANQPNEMALTICKFFRLMRDWKLENLENGEEISTVPFGMEKRTTSVGSLPFSVESEMERKFLWEIRSEIVDYLQG